LKYKVGDRFILVDEMRWSDLTLPQGCIVKINSISLFPMGNTDYECLGFIFNNKEYNLLADMGCHLCIEKQEQLEFDFV